MIRRSTGRTGRWLLPLLLLLFGGPLAAQDPPRPPRVDTLRVDTARIDTIAVPPDTPVVAPTERQLVRFPAMPISPAAGPAAGEWVARNGASDRVRVVGFDLLDQTIDLILDGAIQATIDQAPERQGFEAVNLLVRFLGGETIGDIDTGVGIYTSENIDEVLAN